MSEVILKAENIHKIYKMGDEQLEVLKGIDLTVNKGEALCIMGASGAGKSTLLHILGTLDQPTLGRVFFRDQEINQLSDEEQAQWRNKSLGFVFQFHHLLSEFNAIENIMMPARISGESMGHAKRRAEELMSLLGLSDRKKHYPNELSGGEQQRVAIARALIQEPEILLADEPTGNLDTKNERIIQDLFFELKDKLDLTLITVTHDSGFASRFPRKMTMQDGQWL